MLLKLIFVCLVLLFEQMPGAFARYGVSKNLTEFLRHRQKRTLTFNDGGSVKLVIGPVFPIELGDPISWRSVLCLYNIHVGNYNIPSSPLYPWNKWNNFYARSNQGKGSLQPDESREFLYLVLENFMDQAHGNGRECLLRAICENAQVTHHMDFFGEILNVILTPGRGDVHAVYSQAYEVGTAGADCLHYYSKCPLGISFIDQFLIHDTQF